MRHRFDAAANTAEVTTVGRINLQSTSITQLASGSGAPEGFPLEPTTRQPADAIGPRASRTIASILEASREVFLTRGYAGTTIDEITRAAGVSRASFYTYFPSKRDVLLAVGARSASEALKVIRQLRTMTPSLDALTHWVGSYFQLLDTHGAFAYAWTQAAQEDEDIRSAGMATHLEMCRKFGEALQTLGGPGSGVGDPTVLGLVSASAMERGWDYTRLYDGSVIRSDVEAQIGRMLWGSIRSVAPTL